MIVIKKSIFKLGNVFEILLLNLILSLFISVIWAGDFSLFSFAIVFIAILFNILSLPLLFTYSIPPHVIYLIVVTWAINIIIISIQFSSQRLTE